MMKYAYFSNWIEYWKVPEINGYYVRNNILDRHCIIPANDMEFAKTLKVFHIF